VDGRRIGRRCDGGPTGRSRGVRDEVMVHRDEGRIGHGRGDRRMVTDPGEWQQVRLDRARDEHVA
jgi:hypothetical protein